MVVNWTMSDNFINSSSTSAVIVQGLYDNVGGSWFATIMLIVLFVMLIAIIMRVPLDFTAIIVLPLLVSCAIYVPDFKAVLGVFLIYVGALVGKNILFNR